jgi:hypothetical protein
MSSSAEFYSSQSFSSAKNKDRLEDVGGEGKTILNFNF